MLFRQLLLVSSLLLSACSSGTEKNKASFQNMLGRDAPHPEGLILREEIYRARVPSTWRREDPEGDLSNQDSRMPICTFHIGDGLILWVHNFPSDDLERRIPPQAQVSRWARQFEKLDPGWPQKEQQAHGGFAGLSFEAQGLLKGQHKAVLAWAMQLDPQHFRALSYRAKDWEEKSRDSQMRADYTIKAEGNPEEMEQHRQDIILFARSFELIDPIPEP